MQQFVNFNDTKPVVNSTYPKVATQWLNQALYSVSSSVVADSFRLRNRQLLVAAKFYRQSFNSHQNKNEY